MPISLESLHPEHFRYTDGLYRFGSNCLTVAEVTTIAVSPLIAFLSNDPNAWVALGSTITLAIVHGFVDNFAVNNVVYGEGYTPEGLRKLAVKHPDGKLVVTSKKRGDGTSRRHAFWVKDSDAPKESGDGNRNRR